MTSPVALIIGAGGNVGLSVARSFSAAGYSVALVSRSYREKDHKSYFHVVGDLSSTAGIKDIFAKVNASLGVPSTVVYNAYSMIINPADDPFALSTADLESSLAVNTVGLFAAAQEAVAGFKKLPADTSKSFIYTGNRLNIEPMAPLLTLGVGKTASAHIIEMAASAYQDKGYKFYYADERTPDGAPANVAIDGPAHGKFYLELAQSKAQGPWLATFVKGVGYTKFH